MYAADVPKMNPVMDERLRDLYDGTGAELETIPHEDMYDGPLEQ